MIFTKTEFLSKQKKGKRLKSLVDFLSWSYRERDRRKGDLLVGYYRLSQPLVKAFWEGFTGKVTGILCVFHQVT